MTLATAFAALLLWGGTGGRAYAQPLLPEYLSGQSGVLNIYGAGESKTLPAGNHSIDIYAYGPATGAYGGPNIVINSYNAGGHYQDYTNIWKATINTGSSCGSNADWLNIGSSDWSLVRTDTTPDHITPLHLL